jgi:integrase
MAKSIFARKIRALLPEFKLTDPLPFHGVAPLPERPHRYLSQIDPLDIYDAAKVQLQSSQSEVFIIVILSLFCGMRRGEIDKLTWDQVDLENRHIWIRTTPHFRPKARNSESRIDALPEVFEHLREYQSKSITPPFVLPGDNQSRVRCQPFFDAAVTWLRTQGITDRKPLHTLRKEAGSLVYQRTGSIDLAAEFLRNDPRTAREHYVGLKGRLEVVLS